VLAWGGGPGSLVADASGHAALTHRTHDSRRYSVSLAGVRLGVTRNHSRLHR
jgi:hypothetical protein